MRRFWRLLDFLVFYVKVVRGRTWGLDIILRAPVSGCSVVSLLPEEYTKIGFFWILGCLDRQWMQFKRQSSENSVHFPHLFLRARGPRIRGSILPVSGEDFWNMFVQRHWIHAHASVERDAGFSRIFHIEVLTARSKLDPRRPCRWSRHPVVCVPTSTCAA